jgi:hypothetical protein
MSRLTADSEAAQLLSEGMQSYFAENIGEAKTKFLAAQDEDPTNALICRWIAEVEWRSNQWASALAACQSALRLDETICHRFYDEMRIDACALGSPKPPIFIVGCGHSGTSLLLAILGYHKEIFAVPYESALFTHSDPAVCALMHEWDSACNRDGKSRWVEKTPLHVLQIGRWLKLQPKARIIYVVRDGRDVVASLSRRPEWQDIEKRIDRWLYDNIAGIQYRTHPQVLTVKYEELVADPEAIISKICQFLDEEYYSQLLEYYAESKYWYSSEIVIPRNQFKHNSHEDHMNLRNWQINQPIFDGRGAWREVLSSEEIFHIKRSPMQALLEQLGYVENENW